MILTNQSTFLACLKAASSSIWASVEATESRSTKQASKQEDEAGEASSGDGVADRNGCWGVAEGVSFNERRHASVEENDVADCTT